MARPSRSGLPGIRIVIIDDNDGFGFDRDSEPRWLCHCGDIVGVRLENARDARSTTSFVG